MRSEDSRMIYNQERPLNFDQMVGQELIVQNIRNQSKLDRFFPVFVLCGQYGSGKTTMALLIAMAANCEHKDENGNPCGQCDSCRAVLAHSKEGVIEIDGATNNGVDHMRKVMEQAMTLGVFRKKVIIIDEAHMMSKAAFNAMLITLENPPEHCIFILCTTEADALPETITSRMPVYTFGKIPDKLIKEHVLEVAGRHQIRITEDAAGLIARYAKGAMRNALQILEQMARQVGEDAAIEAKDVILTLGLSSMEQRASFLNACLQGDVKTVVQTLRDCEKGGISLRTFVRDVLAMNMDVLLMKANAEVVGTQYYMEQLKGLCTCSDKQLIRANKMLSAIAATHNSQLSVERITAEVVSEFYRSGAEMQSEEHQELVNSSVKDLSNEVKTPGNKASEASAQAEAEEEEAAPKAGKEEEPNEFKEMRNTDENPFDSKKADEKDAKTQSGFMDMFGGMFGCGIFQNFGMMETVSEREVDASAAVAGSASAAPKPAEDITSHEQNDGKSCTFLPEELLHNDTEELIQAESHGKESEGHPVSKDEESSEMKEADSGAVEPEETEEKIIFTSDEVDEDGCIIESDTGHEAPVLEESNAANSQGRLTWADMVQKGILPDKVLIPKPESKEELERAYEATEGQVEEPENMARTGKDLIEAREELRKLLTDPGFKMLYSKARVVEDSTDYRIQLYFENAVLAKACKLYLVRSKGIVAVLDKK